MFEKEYISFMDLPSKLKEIFEPLENYIVFIQRDFNITHNKQYEYVIEINKEHNTKYFENLLTLHNYNYITIHYSIDNHIVYIISTLKYLEFYNDFFDYHDKRDFMIKKNKEAIIQVLGDAQEDLTVLDIIEKLPTKVKINNIIKKYIKELVDDRILVPIEKTKKYRLSDIGNEYYFHFLSQNLKMQKK